MPSPEALDLSRRLSALIRSEIARAGGWIPFARFMELALYAPGLGYYSAGAAKFGEPGDFVTAPEISPLFGRTLARQVAQVLQATGGSVLEAGAGSGRLACQLLGELGSLAQLPDRYLILEVSADLRERQQRLIRQEVPHLSDRVAWLDTLPERFDGVILGNEVLDAMPVHLVVWHGTGLRERGVAEAGEGFVWQDRPLADGPLWEAARQQALPDDYVSEISLAGPAFVATLAGILGHGAILLMDYGFGSGEYYHPQRRRGTLMCHYRHRAHDDPFYFPGLQDITAHVNFSAIAESGIEHGLKLLGYTTQASFLVNCGITAIMGQTPAEQLGTYLPLAAGAQKLLSPAEMGELFKVIALGKTLPEPLVGFLTGDRSRSL